MRPMMKGRQACGLKRIGLQTLAGANNLADLACPANQDDSDFAQLSQGHTGLWNHLRNIWSCVVLVGCLCLFLVMLLEHPERSLKAKDCQKTIQKLKVEIWFHSICPKQTAQHMELGVDWLFCLCCLLFRTNRFKTDSFLRLILGRPPSRGWLVGSETFKDPSTITFWLFWLQSAGSSS